MSTITRYRIINKYNIAVFALFLTCLLVIMYFEIHLDQVNALFFDPQRYDIANLPKAEQEEYRISLYNILIKFEYYAYAAIGSIIMALPILSCATVWTFAQEKKLLPFCYPRTLRARRTVCSSVFTNALIQAAVLYAAYAVYLGIGVLITNIASPDIDLNFWDFLFGQDFGNSHIILHFLLVGLIQVFLFAFVYCLFSYAVMLVTSKIQWGFLVPLVYYFAGNFLFAGTNSFTLEFLRPGFTTAMTAYAGFPRWWSVSPLVIPLVVSLALLLYALHKEERVGI